MAFEKIKMQLKEQDIQEIQERLKPLIGKKADRVYRMFGSFIKFELGDKIPDGEDVTRSEWRLYIGLCVWRLQTQDDVICGSEDPHSHMDPTLKLLENRIFLSFEVFSPSLEITITFEQGLILRLFPIYTDEEGFRHLELFTPDNHVLILGPGNNWVYKRSDVPDD